MYQKMKHLLKRTGLRSLCALSILVYTSYATADSPLIRIGIIVPIEHAALTEIVEGFKEDIQAAYPGKVKFYEENAQGDPTLQQAMIKKLAHQNLDLLVPVTTSTSQMAIKAVRETPVLTLAALYTEKERLSRTPTNITGILDELPVPSIVGFVHALLPNAKKITLIYNSESKIVKQAEEFKAAAKSIGLPVQALMFQHLSELYTLIKAIDPSTELLVILKDNMAASGIATLINIAKKCHIPLLTADEGTVAAGATLSLGVVEKDIGRTGAAVAKKILSGTSIPDLPLQQVEQVYLFYNSKALQSSNLSMAQLQHVAHAGGYTLVDTVKAP